MNPLFDISVTLYYRIHNSDWFGGVGSVGYSKISLGHICNAEGLDDMFLSEQRAATAGMCGIQPDDVEMIPWETYEAETAEEDETDEADF